MLEHIRETAENIARQAGALLLDYAARGFDVNTKTTSINLVTEADQAAEALITAAIRAVFPDHAIVGEEGGGYDVPGAADAPYRWYVDPLDGTTNFAHHLPIYAVNLSVVDRSGEPVVGLTYDPSRDECFSVIRGQGATLNNRPIHVSATSDLLGALLTSGFPYDRHTAQDNNWAEWGAFLRRAQGVRCTGSAALDMAYVACGRFDGYWERGPQPWDFLAGILMIREAGGQVTTYAGRTDGLYSGHEILASNGRIHQAMVDVLEETQAALRASGS